VAEPLGFLNDTYEVLEALPESGGGARYRLRHRRLGGERVVELIPVPDGDLEMKERLRDAASALGRIGDPHIARIEDFGFAASGLAFVVMERQPGRPLNELLESEGAPPFKLALEIACQASGGLAKLHRRGLLHRDITPSRLAMSRDVEGHPFVAWIDFGLARLVESTASGGLYIGKVRYAAPEHFGAGESSEATSASDVYALALVLYQVFTGHFPIEGSNATSIIAGHLFRPPRDFAETDPHGQVSDAVRDVLLCALAKSRGERYEDAGGLFRALSVLRNHDTPPSPTAEVWLARALGIRGGEQTVTARTGTDWLGEVEPDSCVEGGEFSDGWSDDALSTMAWIERLLMEGDLDGAQAALGRAAQTFSGHPRLETLGRRLEATRAERLALASGSEAQWVQAETLVERARTLSGSENFQEAQLLAREAMGLAPHHPDAVLLSSSLQALLAWRDQEDRGQRDLDEAVEEIRRLLNDRRTGEAMARLQRAITRYGEVPELQKLRRVTADAFLYGDSYVDLPAPAVAAPRVVAPVTMPVPVVSSQPAQVWENEGPVVHSTSYEKCQDSWGAEGGTQPEILRVSPAVSPLEDLPLAGLGNGDQEEMVGAPSKSCPLEADGTPPRAATLDLTDPRTWLLVIAIVVVFLLLGMWLARRDIEAGAIPEPSVEDVVKPTIKIAPISKW
jgi:tetratricopeptide (TPR) repeat protein